MNDDHQSPLPQKVLAQLQAMQRQIDALMDARASYLRGVLDAPGVEGDIQVDVRDGTFSTEEKVTDGIEQDEP
jgi:hypothetical protein